MRAMNPLRGHITFAKAPAAPLFAYPYYYRYL